MNLSSDSIIFRVRIKTHYYDEYGNTSTNTHIKEFDSVDSMNKWAYTIINSDGVYKSEIETFIIPPKSLESINLSL